MKTFLRPILFLFLLAGVFIPGLIADPPSNPPSPPGGGHGGGNNQSPAGAPIDGGLGVLFVLGTACAGIKHFKNKHGRRQKNNF
jgi:hypothetical protein